MQNFIRGTFLKLTLQSNHVAASRAVRNFPTICAKRCFHFVNGEASIRSLAFHHKRRLSNFNSFYIGGLQSGIRWSSTDNKESSQPLSSVTDTASLPEGYIPEPPIPPPSVTSEAGTDLIQQLNALGEPTLQSLGLGGWLPNGMVQNALEAIHVGLNVPWWTAIVIGTVCLRVAMFPLIVISQRNTASMHNHMPIIQKLQAKFSKARMSGNPLEAARAGAEVMDYMKKHKVNPLRNMLMPFVQLPIFISVFVGIRQMANLPVESMTTGGIAWFTDLTIPDPYYALPLLTMATFFVTLELGVDGVRAATMSKNLRLVMRAMPFIFFPFIINFPAGMLCYWAAANGFSLFQVLFLKIGFVRKFCKIPEMVVHDPSIVAEQKKPFFKGIKENWKNSKTMISVDDRQREEAVRFKEAGLGAVQKTYSYDPTKVKSKSTISAKQK